MILYAMIVRTRDGMALSASTDFNGDLDRNLKDCKFYIKALAKKVAIYPERCIMKFKSYIILLLGLKKMCETDVLPLHLRDMASILFKFGCVTIGKSINETKSWLITSLGVSYIALCEHNYPTVLAYSFLDDIMKEFTTVYDLHKIADARRPYAFIEYDNFIHKLSVRYNNPRTLATQMDLTDLSNDIKARPPHIISIRELIPEQNGVPHIGPLPQLEPISWVGMLALVVSCLCALINFYRGLTAMSMNSLEDFEGPTVGHALCFIFESGLQCTQIYLLLVYIGRRNTRSCIALFFIMVCNLYLWDVRDLWIILTHTGAGCAITFATITRHFEKKKHNYNV